MWPTGSDVEQWLKDWAEMIAPKYLREWRAIRPPMFVKLPDGSEFCIDTRAYNHDNGGYYGDGWTVSGTPPAIVLSPSINIVGRYHGWIGCNPAPPGCITADCEGRQFPNAKGLP
jgi:hypothetical protein